MKVISLVLAAALTTMLASTAIPVAQAAGLRVAPADRLLSSSSGGGSGGGSTPTTSGGGSGGGGGGSTTSSHPRPSPSPAGSTTSSGGGGSTPTTSGGSGTSTNPSPTSGPSTTSTGTSSDPSPTAAPPTTSTGTGHSNSTSTEPSPSPGSHSTTSTSSDPTPTPPPAHNSTSTAPHDDAYGPSGGGYGMDVSSFVSQTQWTCLKGQGNDFAIVRAWHSFGGFDSNAPQTLSAAQAAGLSTSIYMFPCAGKSASAQVQSMLSQLGGGYDTAWLDIETNPSGGCGWSGDTTTNCAFIKEALTALQQGAGNVGAYVSPFMWSSIAGDACTAGSDLGAQLWYPTYDGSDTCDDFSPFGGWTSPVMKQYTASYSACGTSGEDRNVRC